MSGREIANPTWILEGFPTVYADGFGVGIGEEGKKEVMYVRVHSKARNLQLLYTLDKKSALAFAELVTTAARKLKEEQA